jgi:hypothetical protein
MVHEVFRTEELAERRRAHSVDHARFEVEEIRARYVHAVRGQVVKLVDEVELRVVVAAVLAVAPEAALVAQHLLKCGTHMVTAPAHQYMRNLAHRTVYFNFKMKSHLKLRVEVEDRPEKKSETLKPHLNKQSMISHHLAVSIGHGAAEL